MLNRRLSRTCNLEDFLVSETAIRLGLHNDPANEVVVERLQLLAERIIEPVGDAFDTRPMITSGYRGPALNTAIGGSEKSQHLSGQAVDFQVPGVAAIDVARWVAEHLVFDQLILEQDSTGQEWVHCSYVSPEANRGQVMHMKGGAFFDGLPETWP